MEEIVKAAAEKVSHYNLLNTLFPGAVFCVVVHRFSHAWTFGDNLLEELFLWYFIGVIISRIGSICVEKCLKKIRCKGKPYLEFADYQKYLEATDAHPFLKTLMETSNMYRTMIALAISLIVAYVYDWVGYDWICTYFPFGVKGAFVVLCILLAILFVISYRKQTDYIKRRVEKYSNPTSEPKEQEGGPK